MVTLAAAKDFFIDLYEREKSNSSDRHLDDLRNFTNAVVDLNGAILLAGTAIETNLKLKAPKGYDLLSLEIAEFERSSSEFTRIGIEEAEKLFLTAVATLALLLENDIESRILSFDENACPYLDCVRLAINLQRSI